MNTSDTLLVVRCPYCVAGADFRPMVSDGDGLFVCPQCEHIWPLRGKL